MTAQSGSAEAPERRTVLVTGGGSGIGAAVARRFAVEGCSVLIAGRRAAPLREVAAAIGAAHLACDITDDTQVATLRAWVEANFARLDVLVNAAGTTAIKPFLSIARSETDSLVATNLIGPIQLLQQLLPLMRRPTGSIVLVSSLGALQGSPNMAVYSAAKAGLHGLVHSLAVELGPSGLRVNAVAPGLIRTPMNEGDFEAIARGAKMPADRVYAAATAMVPLRRAGLTDEVAGACAFLAGQDAAYVTGQVLCVDGGAGIAGSIVPNVMSLIEPPARPSAPGIDR